jgi:succinate dehydrogenase hydrophobic anchor subunit
MKTIFYLSMVFILFYFIYSCDILEDKYFIPFKYYLDLLGVDKKYNFTFYDGRLKFYDSKRFKNLYVTLRLPYIIDYDFRSLTPENKLTNKKQYVFFLFYVKLYITLIHYLFGLLNLIYDYLYKKILPKNVWFIVFFHIFLFTLILEAAFSGII